MHHKMKFSPVILVFTLVIVLVTAQWKLKKVTFQNDCDSNDWILTNLTAEWNNETKHIEAIITYNQPGRPIYKIHTIIDDCKNRTSCSKPRIYVTTIDCKPNNIENLSESDKSDCRIAEEARKREKEDEWLTSRYHAMGKELFNTMACINLDAFFMNIEFKDSSSEETTESSE